MWKSNYNVLLHYVIGILVEFSPRHKESQENKTKRIFVIY